jgi:hypothetical protein
MITRSLTAALAGGVSGMGGRAREYEMDLLRVLLGPHERLYLPRHARVLVSRRWRGRSTGGRAGPPEPARAAILDAGTRRSQHAALAPSLPGRNP